ncbi:MAG: hypothetical protein GF308_02575 [Candidatus Heimdallarchaeota archaeon]|nr:hypothetical protein [Candidatus Heimdallarchaeota archaeon]
MTFGKKKLFILSPVILCLLLAASQISPVQALSFPMSDGTNDVVKALNGVYHSKGDYQDDIDIVSIAKVGDNIEVTFQATPVIDGNHYYLIYIYWDGDDESLNTTFCMAGNQYGSTPYNDVQTALFDSNEMPVVIHNEDDVVTVNGDKLVFPILNESLIQDSSNPQTIDVAAIYDVGDSSEMYYDYYPDDESEWTDTTGTTPEDTTTDGDGFAFSTNFPGYTWGLTILAIGTVTIILVALYRKRK